MFDIMIDLVYRVGRIDQIMVLKVQSRNYTAINLQLLKLSQRQ